jgi:hypothetical protein
VPATGARAAAAVEARTLRPSSYDALRSASRGEGLARLAGGKRIGPALLRPSEADVETWCERARGLDRAVESGPARAKAGEEGGFDPYAFAFGIPADLRALPHLSPGRLSRTAAQIGRVTESLGPDARVVLSFSEEFARAAGFRETIAFLKRVAAARGTSFAVILTHSRPFTEDFSEELSSLSDGSVLIVTAPVKVSRFAATMDAVSTIGAQRVGMLVFGAPLTELAADGAGYDPALVAEHLRSQTYLLGFEGAGKNQFFSAAEMIDAAISGIAERLGVSRSPYDRQELPLPNGLTIWVYVLRPILDKQIRQTLASRMATDVMA